MNTTAAQIIGIQTYFNPSMKNALTKATKPQQVHRQANIYITIILQLQCIPAYHIILLTTNNKQTIP